MNEIFKYLLTAITFFIIDIIWIRLFAMSMYQKYIAEIMTSTVRPLPIILFYIFYPLILYIVLKLINVSSLQNLLIISFLIGVLAYGTYNLTNMGILKEWNWSIVIIDTIWGGALTAISMYIIHLLNK